MGLRSAFGSVCLSMFLLVWITEAVWQPKVFNVMNYGAKADGKTDNSQALGKAWSVACKWKGNSRVLIPTGTYLVQPVIFKGPCNGAMTFLIKGELKAPSDEASRHIDHWITFQYINDLTVSGGGSLDGQGPSAWPYNQCHKDAACGPFPVTMRFDFVTNSRVHHITSTDSKNFHFNIFGCENMNFRNIRISAPGESPNTDGIHIGNSKNINISHSVIGTGDDCVSLSSGSRMIHISDVFCGPGHGISVGSLGKQPNEEDVAGLTVRNCTFAGTSNGVRIKAWAPSLATAASDFTFEHLFMNNVSNPIVIDQLYCPYPPCNPKASSHVHISNVKYRNIWGVSSSKVAVNLQCSQSSPCQNIELENIYLDYHGPQGPPATSSCSHVNGISRGHQKPPSCI